METDTFYTEKEEGGGSKEEIVYRNLRRKDGKDE